MGRFVLEVDLDGDDMQDPRALASALEGVAGKVRALEQYPQKILDANGNTVGEWTVRVDG